MAGTIIPTADICVESNVYANIYDACKLSSVIITHFEQIANDK